MEEKEFIDFLFILINMILGIGFGVFLIFALFLYIFIAIPEDIKNIKNYLKEKYGK